MLPLISGQLFSALANGKFWFWIIPLLVPTTAVKSWLPQGVALISEHEAQTPIVLWLGRQKSVTVGSLPHPPWDYNEFMVFVPNVRSEDGTYNHSPLLYLDHTLAIYSGKLLGYPKERASFEITENTYRVMNDGKVLVEATFPEDGVDFVSPLVAPWFNPAKHFITNPIVQVDLLGVTHHLDYDWGVESGHARVRPTKANVKILEEILPGLKGSFEVPSLENAPFGAFRIETEAWTLKSSM